MKILLNVFVAIFMVMAGTGIGTAGLISYDESTDGNLTATSTNVGAINMAGVSTISGTLAGTPPTDVDNLFFTLDSGFDVTSIVLSFSSPLQNGEVVTAGLFTPSNNLFDDNFGAMGNGDTGATASLTDNFPPDVGMLGGPQWNFELNGSVVFSSVDWSLTITTEDNGSNPDVPEPSTLLALAVVGIVGIVSRRRKLA